MAKVTTACNPCAVRKIKCNGTKPCPACMRSGFDCTYSVRSKRGPKGPRPATRARIDETTQQAAASEAGLQLIRSNSDTSSSVFQPSPGSPSLSGSSPHAGYVAAEHPRLKSERSSTYATTTSTPASVPSNFIGDSDFTIDEITAYLNLYHSTLYPVWPVVDHAGLLRKLRFEPQDMEFCTLAFALCAALTARLRINGPNDTPNTAPELTTSSRFAALAENHRSRYTYRAQASVASILIPFFLHVHYDCQCRVFMDSILLREAISVAQLMNLDKTSGYTDGISPQEQAHRRKIFWLLFVSEKGCAMMRDFPTSLQPSVPLPNPSDETNPNLITAFISLVRLFAAVYDVFGSSAGALKQGLGGPTQQYTSAFFASLQEQLGQQPEFGPQTHEVQRADVFLTQQWLQVLVWRFSISRVDMSRKDGEEALSFIFPAKVAKCTLNTLETLSLESIVAHGRGMEQKVFEIACTLLDVINVIPSESLHRSDSSRGGPMSPPSGSNIDNSALSEDRDAALKSPQITNRDIQQAPEDPLPLLQSLSSILSIIGGRHSPYIGLLHKKIAESPAPLTPGVLDKHTPSPRTICSSPTGGTTMDRSHWEHNPSDESEQQTLAARRFTRINDSIGWSEANRNGATHVAASVQTSQAFQPRNHSRDHLTNPTSGHWPIGTEILGTMSEVGYLDGWRGRSQDYGQPFARLNANDGANVP